MSSFLRMTIALSAMVSLPAIAGSEQKKIETYNINEVEHFAKSIEKYAANQGARAFIIARVGRPESDLPQGVKFTHTAIAVYSNITLNNGEQVKGYAIHNLYQTQKKPEKSILVTDYPVDFFWGVNTLKAGIIIPTPELQQRIIETVSSEQYTSLHNDNYSVIANPNNSYYQNCTEFTLDIINAGIYQTTSQQQLKANNKRYFKGQLIDENPVKLMLGNWFVKDVTTTDHPTDVRTATFTTIANYLAENELTTAGVIFNKDGTVNPI